jgi:hypothetical protein
MNDTITRWLPPPDPSGPVTCEVCGCRLIESIAGDRRVWRHFTSLHPGQDARGCRPRCVDAFHGRDGAVIDLARDPVGFRIDDGMDEVLLPARREDAAAA